MTGINKGFVDEAPFLFIVQQYHHIYEKRRSVMERLFCIRITLID